MATGLHGWALLDDLQKRATWLRCDQLMAEFNCAQAQLESMTQEQAEGPDGERLTLWQQALETEFKDRTGAELTGELALYG